MTATGKVYPVILSGGAGSRLWPLSRSAFPKQLLALTGERSLLQQTVLRVTNESRYARPLVVANQEHRFLVAEHLQAIGCTPRGIVLEPQGRNTAPAAAVAALLLLRDEPDPILVLLPSDHVVRDQGGFDAAVATARAAAAQGALVTFGIDPERPETGYGYIRRGEAWPGCPGAYAVANFVEKPDRATAEAYVAGGDHLWNSGMFVFRAKRFLEELRRLCPDIVAACEQALAASFADLDFIRLDAGAFAACPADSIDYAVMERTACAAVVPAAFGWSDVGGWPALWDLADKDAAGNVALGDAVLEDARDCYLRSEDGRLVAAVGLADTIVVSTPDAVMVVPRERAGEVKQLVERLKREGRSEASEHRRVYRPWGEYNDIDEEEARFRVKRIIVKPGGRLSLQKHKHRSEHWVVVQGRARVTRGEEVTMLEANQSTYIPKGVVHRLENPGSDPLHLIEVQVGDYLGEDDIVRLEDTYGRS